MVSEEASGRHGVARGRAKAGVEFASAARLVEYLTGGYTVLHV